MKKYEEIIRELGSVEKVLAFYDDQIRSLKESIAFAKDPCSEPAKWMREIGITDYTAEDRAHDLRHYTEQLARFEAARAELGGLK